MIDLASVHWLTTAPSPYRRCTGPDDGQRGWRTHALIAGAAESLDAIGRRGACCGLEPAHGWGMDLFIDKMCMRCLQAIGHACKACKGRGNIGGEWCLPCLGKGMAR